MRSMACAARTNTVDDLGPYLDAPLETLFPPVVIPRDVRVQTSASLHVVPSGSFGFEQPVPGSHVPATWH